MKKKMQVEGENEYCQWRKGEKKEGEKKKKKLGAKLN